MDEIIEIFGAKYKVVHDKNDDSEFCGKCDLQRFCFEADAEFCEDTNGEFKRHFELYEQ